MVDENDKTTLTNYTNNTNENNEQSSEHSKHHNGKDGSKTSSTTAVNIAHYKPPAIVPHGHVPNIRSRSTSDLPSFTNKPAPVQRQFSAVEYTPTRSDIIVTDVSHSWTDIHHIQLGSTPQYRVIYKDGCQDEDNDPDRDAVYDR